MIELKEILKQYQSKNITKLYLDKTLDTDGINYENYIGLKFETINNNHIRDKYTINGWYILWYLMSEAHQSMYIKTTIDFIAAETKMNHKDIKDILIHLHNINAIYMVAYTISGKEKSFKSITYNECIEIAIGYSNKDSYEDTKGYKAIPVEFVKSVLLTLNPTAWALYTVLVVRHSFLLTLPERIDPETGEIIYPYSITHYAFTTQEQLGECIGVTDTTIKKYTDELLNSKYPLIHLVAKGKRYRDAIKGNKEGWKRENKRYGVYLLERVEYQYYHTCKVEIKRTKEEEALIKKIGAIDLLGTENQYILRQKDYILDIVGSTMPAYEKALNNHDTKWYEENRQTMKIETPKSSNNVG